MFSDVGCVGYSQLSQVVFNQSASKYFKIGDCDVVMADLVPDEYLAARIGCTVMAAVIFFVALTQAARKFYYSSPGKSFVRPRTWIGDIPHRNYACIAVYAFIGIPKSVDPAQAGDTFGPAGLTVLDFIVQVSIWTVAWSLVIQWMRGRAKILSHSATWIDKLELPLLSMCFIISLLFSLPAQNSQQFGAQSLIIAIEALILAVIFLGYGSVVLWYSFKTNRALRQATRSAEENRAQRNRNREDTLMLIKVAFLVFAVPLLAIAYAASKLSFGLSYLNPYMGSELDRSQVMDVDQIKSLFKSRVTVNFVISEIITIVFLVAYRQVGQEAAAANSAAMKSTRVQETPPAVPTSVASEVSRPAAVPNSIAAEVARQRME